MLKMELDRTYNEEGQRGVICLNMALGVCGGQKGGEDQVNQKEHEGERAIPFNICSPH